jgi:hypothetical protein
MARISAYLSGCLLSALLLSVVYRLAAGHGHSLIEIISWGLLLSALAVCTLVLTFRRNAVFKITSAIRPSQGEDIAPESKQNRTFTSHRPLQK